MITDFEQIWFDFDGTLAVRNAQFDAAHDKLLHQVYSDATGQPLSEKAVNEYKALYQKHHSNSAVFKSLGFPDGYWIEHFEAADLSSYYEPRTDVPEVLKEIGERAVLGIFTNNKSSAVEKTLARLKIPSELFRYKLTGDSVNERKPAMRGFEMMLAQAGCKPDELLYVGDRYNVDVEPAQKLGMKGALVWSEDTRADFSFPKFTDLLN